ARNVLMEAGLHRRGAEADIPAPASETFAWVELDASGRVVLPAELLSRAGLAAGSVHVRVTDDGLEILSRSAALARAQKILAPYIPDDVSLVDELIAER